MTSKYRFDQIAIVSTEKKKPTEADKENYVGLEHLSSDTFEVVEYGSEVAPKGEKLVMKKGDVLFGKRRAYQKKVGIAPCDGIFSAHGMVLRPNEEVIDALFFPFFIKSDVFLDEAIRISVGSLSPTVNWRDLRELKFNLPSLDRQHEVAELLWAGENLKTTYRRLQSACDEQVKSRFVEMFGDPVSGDKWPKTRIVEVCDVRIGPFGSMLHKDDCISGGHPLINPSHIQDGKLVPDNEFTVDEATYERLEAYQLKYDDVVLGRRGEMGRCAVVYRNDCLCGTGSMIVRPGSKCRSDYMQKVISHPSFVAMLEQNAVGVTLKNLNAKTVGEAQFCIPPIDLQEEYAAFVKQVDKSEFALKQAIDSVSATMTSVLNQELGMSDV